MAQPTQASVDLVQQAYIAFYGRPADPLGLNYWANQLDANGGHLDAIINQFGNSAESVSLYGNQSPASQINAIYEQLFGRAPDAQGLQYYANLLQSGQATAASLAMQILQGASGADAQIIANKLAVSEAFTQQVAANVGNTLAYQGDNAAAAVRNLLHSVDDTAGSVTTVEGEFGTCLTNIHNDVPGQTFTLTTSTDTLVGTAGNDVIDAPTVTLASGVKADTLGAFDHIDGGAGIDTLNVTDTAGAGLDTTTMTGLSIQNVEVVNIESTGAVTVDSTNWSGLNNLNITDSGASTVTAAATTAVSINGDGSGVTTVNGGSTVTVTNDVGNSTASAVDVNAAQGTTSVSVTQEVGHTGTAGAVVILDNTEQAGASNTASDTITSVTLDGYGAASSVSSDTLSNLTLANSANDVTVNDGSTDAQTLNLTVDNLSAGASLTDASVSTLNVTTGAHASEVEIVANEATALNVSGASNLTLDETTTFAADFAKVKTITVSGSAGLNATVDGTVLTSVDASNTSGALNLQDGVAAANITGGAGDDVVTLNAALTGTINLGAGNNSLLAGAGSIEKGAVVDGGVGGINTISATLLNATDAAQVKDFQALDLTGASGIYDNTLFANDSFTTLDVNGALLANTTVTNMAGNTITVNADGSGSGLFDLTATLANSDKATAATGDSAVINFGASTNSATAVTDTLQSFNSTELTSVTINSSGVVHHGDVSADLANITNTLTTLTDSANDLATVTINGGEHFVLGGVQVDTAASNTAGTIVQAGLKTIDASHTTGGVEITAGANSTSADSSTTITYKGLVIEGGSGQDTITNYAVNGVVTDGDHKLDNVTLGSTAKGASATLGNGAGDIVNLNGDSQTVHVGNGDGDTVNVAGHDAIVNLGSGVADVVNVDNTASIGSVATNDHITTINGLGHGDILSFQAITGTNTTLGNALVLGSGVTSLDGAIAAADTGAASGTVEWFQLGGNTYVVDVVDGTHANDVVVKLAGTIDLSHATVDHTGNSITLA